MPDAPPLHVPPGHHFSPLPSGEDIARALPTDGPGEKALTGVDLREEAQLALLDDLLPMYPETAAWLEAGPPSFRLDNTWFAGSDAVFLALMLRRLRPGRVVEVGCGHSSALALDVDAAYLGGRTAFTFIEPDPARLLELVGPEALGSRLLAMPVQDAGLEHFLALGPGDVLLIDGSHVLKAGSDVHFLLLDVLPCLAPGVIVHVHDIFHPFEYPKAWLEQGVAFTEAYAVRALLQGGSRLRILLWNHFLERFHRERFAAEMPLCLSAPFVTGGIWLEVG